MIERNPLATRGRLTSESLRAWRAALGLTQKQAAEKLQIPFYTYRQYERNITGIPSVVQVAMRVVSCEK